jgi:predicted transcriptional regulator
MSRTVSFRCSEELDEFLEQEAERRMTTKSTAAQMILAEYARESGKVGDTSEGENDASEGANGASEAADTDALDRHPDAWYRPGGEHDFAVRDPSDGSNTKYYKTRDGAATRIRRWYEGEEGADART